MAASGGKTSSNLTGEGGEGMPPSREQGGCALAGAQPVASAPFAGVLVLPALAFFLARAPTPPLTRRWATGADTPS